MGEKGAMSFCKVWLHLPSLVVSGFPPCFDLAGNPSQSVSTCSWKRRWAREDYVLQVQLARFSY